MNKTALSNKMKARFPLRPLWLGSNYETLISPGLAISVPEFFRSYKSTLDIVCRRIVELGYNCILLGSLDHTTSLSPLEHSLDFNEICQIIHAHELQVILKPSRLITATHFSNECPLDPNVKNFWQSALKELLIKVPVFDFLFWESHYLCPSFHHSTFTKDFTDLELVQAETQMIENALQNKISLIYYLPCSDEQMAKHQSSWLSHLCDDVGSKTMVAFSAKAGFPWENHLPLHPFWTVLRCNQDISHTPLMPIVNTGSIKQGDGLWPALTLDLTETIVGRCQRHIFAGTISLVNHLPAKGALLECSLWCHAQMLQHVHSCDLLAETWFETHRPDLKWRQTSSFFRQTREIAIALSKMHLLSTQKNHSINREESRALADSLIAQLNYLQIMLSSNEGNKKSEKFSLRDYFNAFSSDARRIIMEFAHAFHLSLPTLHKENEELSPALLQTEFLHF